MTSTGKGRTDHFTGTMPLPEGAAQVALAESLTRYLRAHVEGFEGAAEVAQFKGGQSNPTFLVSAGARRFVVRRKPPGKLLPSAHAVDREYRVITALGTTDVPVPRTYALCEDETVIGSAFYVMEYVEGRIFWEPSLPGMAPAERARIYDAMNGTLARLHRVDPAAVGLADYGKPGNYFARQIARWSKQYRASEAPPIEAMERLIAWLPEHIPPGEETTIVHGDYRIDNMVFHPTEPRVLAILDWELSTLGHPLGDFAYHCMQWRFGPATGRGISDVNLADSGIPTEEAYVAAYFRRTGRARIEPRHWEFCLAYNMFRLAAILQGIAGRIAAGTASSAHAVETASRARPIAEEAWRLVEQIESR